jgi:hypothetical protein
MIMASKKKSGKKNVVVADVVVGEEVVGVEVPTTLPETDLLEETPENVVIPEGVEDFSEEVITEEQVETQEEIITEEPVTEEPITESPATEEPITEEPVAEAPSTDVVAWTDILRELGAMREAKSDVSCLKYAYKALEPWSVGNVVDKTIANANELGEAKVKEITVALYQWGLYFLTKQGQKRRSEIVVNVGRRVPELGILERSRTAWREIAKAEYEAMFGEVWKGC